MTTPAPKPKPAPVTPTKPRPTWGRNLAVQVLEDFAAVARCVPRNDTGEVSDVVDLVRERNRDRMRELRADAAYRRREQDQENQRRADKKCQAAVRLFVSQRNGLRWTDPGSPWMADVILEVET